MELFIHKCKVGQKIRLYMKNRYAIKLTFLLIKFPEFGRKYVIIQTAATPCPINPEYAYKHGFYEQIKVSKNIEGS